MIDPQTTLHSNLQGKYVDVDRVKSKTLQSELNHKLYATKKGAPWEMWRREGLKRKKHIEWMMFDSSILWTHFIFRFDWSSQEI